VVPIVIAAAVVIVVALVGYFAFHKGGGGAALPTSYIQVQAIPYGKVQSITDSKGSKIALPQDVDTPVRIAVNPGDYTVVVAGPDGTTTDSEKIKVTNDNPGAYAHAFAPVDVDKILQSSQ
jgi:hypothetical protein